MAGSNSDFWKRLGSRIATCDRNGFGSDFDSWPELARRAWRASSKEKISGHYSDIVFAGMGGSGITGDMACDYSIETGSGFRFHAIKDSHAPSWIGKGTLVIGVSCSGNTAETLSFVKEAARRGAKVHSFGSGGALEKLCGELGAGFTKTEKLSTPRSSFPGIFFAVMRALSENRLLNVKAADVEETIDAMTVVRKLSLQRNDRNVALKTARIIASISNPLPLVYSSSRIRAVGLRVRQSINENAKMHAFNGEIPEACHNDIVGYDFRAGRSRMAPNAAGLFLYGGDESDDTKMRLDFFKGRIIRSGGKAFEVRGMGNSYLSRAISLLYTLEYFTYYLAVLRGVDPQAMSSITELKDRLAHVKH